MKLRKFQVFYFLLYCFVALPYLITADAQDTTIKLNGLGDRVTVRRDGRHIPYIEAKSDNDLYFAQGYITASDRLWQMELMRRVARGELSEIFGKQTLEEDKRWRRFGVSRIADRSLAILPPVIRAALDGYADGVNAYISTLDEKTLPIEFKILQIRPRPWTAADTIAIGKVLADSLSTTWRQDVVRQRLAATLPKQKFDQLMTPVTPQFDVILYGSDTAAAKATAAAPNSVSPSIIAAADRDELTRRRSLERIGFYAEELAASNNWVISGDRTADGKPLLANDPHLDATAPGIWYLTHLTSPTHRVSGVAIPGVPGIVLGHNEYIAWGATNVGPDVQDLYLETFDAAGKYASPDGPQTAVVRNEVIKMRSNPLKTDMEDVVVDVIETRNGPIVADEGGKKYALRWTALDPNNREFEAFYYLNRAKDWKEFTKALSSYVGSTQNFVYADVNGHIGWHAAGRIPIRRSGFGDLPYDGATNAGDWVGYIPFDELPHLFDPPSGFIVTANQRAVGTDYKYPQYTREYAMPWRARRIYELLSKDKKVTMDRVSQIQHDVFNRPVKTFAAEIVLKKAADPASIELFKSWDGHMTPDSRAALLANETRNCVGTKLALENLGVSPNMAISRIIDRGYLNRLPNTWLPKAYADYGSLIRACFEQVTTLDMPKKYGADREKWVWGLVSKATFRHPLAAAPLIGAQFATPNVPIAGSRETPNVGSFVSMRHIASPGNWDATRQVIPLGQSGDPRSPFFKDQFELWASGAPAVFPFSEKAVAAAAKSFIVLQPAKP